MNDITRSGTAQLFNESHDKMLAKIRRELREHEYYGLANDRIEWLLNEVDDLREALTKAKRSADILRRET